MGFDDWGAFSILHASGNDPAAILTVGGMMLPSNFTENMAQLLRSWGIETPIFMGSDGCHHDCLNTSFIGMPSSWNYRAKIWKYLPYAVKHEAGDIVPNVTEGAFPWMECKEKYRLLILGPVSDFDYKLWEDDSMLQCIEEIILSGSWFGDTAEGRASPLLDFSTFQNTIRSGVGNLDSVNLEALGKEFSVDSDSSTFRELNVVSDALAAARSLLKAARKGVPVTIIPLNVESVDRYGKQKALKEHPGLKSLDQGRQANLTQEGIVPLCRDGLFLNGKEITVNPDAPNPGKPEAEMLQRMACIRSVSYKLEDAQYPIDMDAIVATYLWRPELFEWDTASLVAMDSVSGMTYSKCRDLMPGAGACQCEDTADVLTCAPVKRATGFDAIDWFAKIQDELLQYPSS
jgi:inosine-uridine nucleoside N-ribohydrolase